MSFSLEGFKLEIHLSGEFKYRSCLKAGDVQDDFLKGTPVLHFSGAS